MISDMSTANHRKYHNIGKNTNSLQEEEIKKYEKPLDFKVS